MSDPVEEIPVRLVQMWLCDLCLDGAGGECHTPGCALWINRAPDLPLRRSPFLTILDAAAAAITDAARHFAATWLELLPDLPDAYDCHMTCAEADAAADLYRALGDDATAQAILDGHGAHDGQDEAHYAGATLENSGGTGSRNGNGESKAAAHTVSVSPRLPLPDESREAYEAYLGTLFAPVRAEMDRLREAASSVRTCPDCGCAARPHEAFCYGCGACLEPAAIAASGTEHLAGEGT